MYASLYLMGEIIIPKLGKKFGYVITRKYKESTQDMRQIIAFYMDDGGFYTAQWVKSGESGDYKHFKQIEISREEYFMNYFYEDEKPLQKHEKELKA